MLDRSQWKKIFFISENRKGIIVSNQHVLIADAKNQIIKEWKGDNIDLLQIKDQPYVALVKRIFEPLRNPDARRYAVTSESAYLAGRTELFHVDKLEEVPFIIPYALSHVMFMNDQFIAFSGLRVIISDFKRGTHYPAGVASTARNLVPLKSYVICFSESFLFDTKLIHIGEVRVETFFLSHIKISQVCALPNDQCLAQNKQGELVRFSISKPGHLDLQKKNSKKTLFKNFLFPDKQRLSGVNPLFKEFLLLPNSPVILARDCQEHLYFIHSETLQVKKIDVNFKEPILECHVSENNNVIAVLKSGEFLNLDKIILKYSYAYEVLFSVTTQPTVLIDLIMSYAGDYNHFFKYAQKHEEIEYFPKQNVI